MGPPCGWLSTPAFRQNNKRKQRRSKVRFRRWWIALEDGHELEEEFRFIDAGYSGASLVRPALEQLRDVAYAGGIDRLYVHSPDRLARKYAYQVLLIEEFDRAGVEVVFLNHAMGKTPEEDLLLQMQGMIAEYERTRSWNAVVAASATQPAAAR